MEAFLRQGKKSCVVSNAKGSGISNPATLSVLASD